MKKLILSIVLLTISSSAFAYMPAGTDRRGNFTSDGQYIMYHQRNDYKGHNTYRPYNYNNDYYYNQRYNREY